VPRLIRVDGNLTRIDSTMRRHSEDVKIAFMQITPIEALEKFEKDH
jgi:hypothetical protein